VRNVVLVVAMAACSTDDASVTPGSTTPRLAASQVSAATVAAPDTPTPCDVDDLAIWTAQVRLGDSTADAVIRVRNDGDAWCEVDIGESASIDPAIEPDVWLDPGESADLVLGQAGDACVDPTLVESAEVGIGGETVVVPTAMLAECGARFDAFYPVDAAVAPCSVDDLDVLAVETFVLVRNGSSDACRLGDLTDVDGIRFSATDLGDLGLVGAASPPVVDLAVGDVVGFPVVWDPVADCDHVTSAGTLIFSAAGSIPGELAECSRYLLGPGRPWFGDPGGPLAGLTSGRVDVEAVRRALDPFSGGSS
jgi:hypothetical protein